MTLTRQERQARERAIPRCAVSGCNQARALDSDLCGTHRIQREAQEARQSDRDDLRSQIDAAETVDDVKEILVAMLERFDR